MPRERGDTAPKNNTLCCIPQMRKWACLADSVSFCGLCVCVSRPQFKGGAAAIIELKLPQNFTHITAHSTAHTFILNKHTRPTFIREHKSRRNTCQGAVLLTQKAQRVADGWCDGIFCMNASRCKEKETTMHI